MVRSKENLERISRALEEERKYSGSCNARENHDSEPHCLVAGQFVEHLICPYRQDEMIFIGKVGYHKCSYAPTNIKQERPKRQTTITKLRCPNEGQQH